MKKPDIPENEAARLQALLSLKLLDTEPDERFDRLTRMAKRMFQVPIALVTLVDAERQWFKSCFGLDMKETSRDISFCGHAILNDQTFVVSNTLADERFADNPLVVDDPKIRFYAGTPIRTPKGLKIGTLCIIDRVARVFHQHDTDMLEDLARMVEREVGTVQLATMDELTQVSNRRGFYLIAEHSLSLCIRHKSDATIVVFELNEINDISEKFGHAESDKILKAFAHDLKQFFRDSDLVARLGGHQFAVVLLNTSSEYAHGVIEKLHASLHSLNTDLEQPYEITFSVGYSTFEPNAPRTIHSLVDDAGLDLNKQKHTKTH